MTKSNFEKIEEFSLAAEIERPLTPTVPNSDTLNLRRQLIQEEYEEVIEALEMLNQGNSDITDLVHELADLLYVVYGTFSACGVDADAVFAEVHRANMQKMDGPRRADGKLLKPPGWKPANIKDVLQALQNRQNNN